MRLYRPTRVNCFTHTQTVKVVLTLTYFWYTRRGYIDSKKSINNHILFFMFKLMYYKHIYPKMRLA